MTNRITGDFDSDAIEAFRAAYAANLAAPEEHDIDPTTGLPSNVISNTSPWLEHTGLWKANDGMSRDFKPNQPFNPDEYLPKTPEPETTEDAELEDTVPESQLEEEIDGGDPLSEDEFDILKKEVWGEDPEDSEEESEESYFEDEGDEDGDEDEQGLNEDEIDALINQILGTSGDDDDDDDDDGVEDSED